ncbi:MAG: cysteine--tRNA ligase [Thermoanaerobaculia bacterium]|nr:cysteine--tRNA ligase [Thermoanaerobaculia bacterium]
MLQIYNSQTRRKEPFVPVDPDGHRVGLYYCGPTVYDSLHLGHVRAAVVPDIMRRYLEHCGYSVRYVSNFTDIDDKIIRRAIRENRSWREVTVIYMEEYYRLISAIGNRPPDVQPRATDHVPEMHQLIENLLDSGNGYVASDGDVYFDTASDDDYGSLSGRKLDEQRVGASGRMTEAQMAVKRSPGDFILWKLLRNDPEDLKAAGEQVPRWPSPWGDGRPGWHLECSALSAKYLGMPFDIHGGGRDLIFPHHENEKAQNDCGYCGSLGDDGESVKFWVHNGFLTLDARNETERGDEYTEGDQAKMSKSLGNVWWLKDTIWPLGAYDPMAVRMLMVQSHYRSPIRFSQDLLDQAGQRVERIYRIVERLRDGLSRDDSHGVSEAAGRAVSEARSAFQSAMDDDFGTPGGLAAIDGLIHASKDFLSRGDDGVAAADRLFLADAIVNLCRILGLRAERLGDGPPGDEGPDELLGLIAELRSQARAAKDWATADRIRDRLSELGWEIRDGEGGASDIVKN